MASDHLVAAYNFPPFNDGSAITMLKRIVHWGHTVDVISKDLSGYRQVDPSLRDLVDPLIDRHDMISGVALFSQWSSVQDFAVRGWNVAKDRPCYASVYSRSMWPHSHILAATVRFRDRAREWLAEFSDPLLWTAEGQRRPSPGVDVESALARELLGNMPKLGQDLLRELPGVLEWCQFVPMLRADRLIFTNDQQLEVMIADLPALLRDDVRARSVVSPHPTLPLRYYGTPTTSDGGAAKDAFRMGYFGSFYPNRGGAEILEAWASLPADIADGLSLDVFSGSAPALEEVSVKVGLEGCVRVRSTLPFLDFLRLTGEFDALLVMDVATSPFGVPSPFLPSKYSDYRGSATPIMAVSLAGSPLDLQDVEWKARVGDTAGIRKMLRAARESKLSNPTKQDGSNGDDAHTG